MRSTLILLCVAALAGCGNEGSIGADLLPPTPSERPLVPENPTQTDTIIQLTPPVVDVQWVIDNSCSMSCIVGCHSDTASVAERVTENFPSFMKHFDGSGVDYHIGVITTDLDDPRHQGRLQLGLGEKWIDNQTQSPLNVFTQMASQGTSGAGLEQGLGASFFSVEEHADGFNEGFLRDQSSLYTVVLADENDQTADSIITTPEYIQWYSSLRPFDKRTFHSLVCVNSATTPCRNGVGTDYIRVTQQVGGIVWDIENLDWSPLLDQMGAEAAGLSAEYFLSSVPVDGTLEVAVEDSELGYLEFEEVSEESPSGYLYSPSRNSIIFQGEYLPSANSTILLTYELASSQFQASDASE